MTNTDPQSRPGKLRKPLFIYVDLGNVLLMFDHDIACRQMSEVSGVDFAQIKKLVFEGSLENQYETGTISTAEFYEAFCRQTGTKPCLDALMHAASDIFSLNARIVPVVSQLAAVNMPMGILSNTCEAHWQFVNNGRFGLLNHFFPVKALSYELKSMKPDGQIYAKAAELAGVEPSEIFFFDDKPENVAGALKAGYDAVHYSSPESLVAELSLRGVELNY